MFYNITAGQSAQANKSIHDDFKVAFAVAENALDNDTTNENQTWFEFKQYLLDLAAIEVLYKDTTLAALLQSTFHPKNKRQAIFDALSTAEKKSFKPDFIPSASPSKKEFFADKRQILCLDFDSNLELGINPDLLVIRESLKSITHIEYTTYNHVKKGNRYRVVIPFLNSYTKDEWNAWVKQSIIAYFHSILPTEKIDNSCTTFAQASFFPSINPEVGFCELYMNDDATTTIFDADLLPRIVTVKKTYAATPMAEYTVTGDNIDKLIDLLVLNPAIDSLEYNHSNLAGNPSRLVLAAALHSIGATDDHILRADNLLGKVGSTVSSAKVLNQFNRGIGHDGIFKKYISYESRLDLGLAQPFEIEKSKWDIEKSVKYLSLQDYTTAKRVLMCADMGTGKNYVWTQCNEDYRLLAPLRSIVGQQGSSNNIKYDKITTYDQAKKLITAIESGLIQPQHEILIIDEAHNLFLSEYRFTALSALEELMKYDWKQIIFQSATIDSDSFDSIIDFDVKVRIHNKNKPTLKIQRHFNNSLSAFQVIAEKLAQNPLKSLVLYNDKEELETFSNLFNTIGMKNFIVSAETIRNGGLIVDNNGDEKPHPAFMLANDDEFLMGDTDIILGTNSLVEGISIQDEVDEVNCFIVGDLQPEFIKQLCGRFRKAKIINCYLIANFVKVSFSIEEWVEEQKTKTKTLLMAAKAYSTLLKYQTFSYADHIDFITSTDISESQLIFDRVTQTYLRSDLSDLFTMADGKKLQFYSSHDYAYAVLKEMGFIVLKHEKIITDKELVLEVKNESKRVKSDSMANRQKSEKHLLGLAKALVVDGSIDRIDFVNSMTEMKLDDTFQYLVVKTISELNVPSLTIKELQDITKRLVTKQSANDNIVKEYWLKESKHGVIADLRRAYPVGTQLDTNGQRDLLSQAFGSIVSILETSLSISRQEAFDIVVNDRKWKNIKDDMELVNGVVKANIEQPLKVVKFFMDVESIKTRINGVQLRMAVIK